MKLVLAEIVVGSMVGSAVSTASIEDGLDPVAEADADADADLIVLRAAASDIVLEFASPIRVSESLGGVADWELKCKSNHPPKP